MSSARELILENRDYRLTIGRLNQEISLLRRKIRENDKNIYKLCEHDWERDPPQINERITYTCIKCRLCKNYYN